MTISERRERSLLCFIAHHGSIPLEKFDEVADYPTYNGNKVKIVRYKALEMPFLQNLLDKGFVRINEYEHTIEYRTGMMSLGPTPLPMEKTSDVLAYLANAEKIGESQV